MENKSPLETYIRLEKTAGPSSDLTDRIMQHIRPGGNSEEKWIQLSGIAASILIALWLGLSLNSPDSTPDNAWNINDTQIENLAFYHTENE